MSIFRRTADTPPVTASAAPSVPVAFRRAQPAAYSALRPLTASAKKLSKSEMDAMGTDNRVYRRWQKDAWTGYDRIGEIHFGFNLVANVFSRVRIHGAAILEADETPSRLSEAREQGKLNSELARDVEDLMAAFQRTDFSSQKRAFALNMSVPGECLLAELPPDEDNVETRWVIRSTDEIVVTADKISLLPQREDRASKAKEQVLAVKKAGDWSTSLNIGRIWRQHPRHTGEPDSSMAAVADSIEELLLVSRMTRSAAKSRLNAGMLFIPDGLNTVSGAAGVEEQAVDEFGNSVTEAASEDVNSFTADLMDTMVAPLTNEDAASAVVPMVVTGDGEMGKQITYMTFERKNDQWLAERADRALERILEGIDVPKDIVTGLANVKYSNAIQIDEDLYKANIEPLALMFVDALTDIYLRPQLRDKGYSEADVNRVCVWYDPSEIVTRPNQSEDANFGYSNDLLSGQAWRRIHGFPETDGPDEKELAIKFLLDKATIPEDVVQALVKYAFPDVMGEERAQNLAGRTIPFPQSADNILNGGSPDTSNGAPAA